MLPTGGTERGGSKAIDHYIFTHLPQKCIDTRSTADYRDMTAEEREDMNAAVKRMNKALKQADKAKIASRAADADVGGVQEPVASSASAETRSGLTLTGEDDHATTAEGEDTGSNVASSSEQLDHVLGDTDTRSETGKLQGLETFGTETRSDHYEYDTDEALSSDTNDFLATKIGPMKVLRSQGRTFTAINDGGMTHKSLGVSRANVSLTTQKSLVCKSSETSAGSLNSNNAEDHIAGEDSEVLLENSKTYILIDMNNRQAQKITFGVNGEFVLHPHDLAAVCQEINGFKFHSPAPITREAYKGNTAKLSRMHGLEGVSFLLICIEDQTLISRLRGANDISTHDCLDVKIIQSTIMDWTTNRPNIERKVDAAPSMALTTHPDLRKVTGKEPRSNHMQNYLMQTSPDNSHKDFLTVPSPFTTAPSLSVDSMQHKTSHLEGHHGQNRMEPITMSEVGSGLLGTIDPRKLLEPVLLLVDIDHTVTKQSLQHSAVAGQAEFFDSTHWPSHKHIHPDDIMRLYIHQSEPSLYHSEPTTFSEAAIHGVKRGREHTMSSETLFMTNYPRQSTPEEEFENTQDIQSDHTPQSKKSRTQSPDLKPNADITEDFTNFEPIRKAPFTMADIDGYLAHHHQKQRQQQYRNRDTMLKLMINSKIPSIVAAAHRNKDAPIDPDLHPAYCGVKLTYAEAHEMNTKMKWLPMGFGFMSES